MADLYCKDCKAGGQFPGLAFVEEYDWGRAYEGERDALIAAGVVQAAWFPGEPGQLKTVGRGLLNGRKIVVRITGSKRRFRALEYFTDAELAPQRERIKIEKARAREAFELASLPSSHEKFRAYAETYLRTILERMRNLKVGGYYYAPDALQEFDDAAEELLETLRSTRTLYDVREHNRIIMEIKDETAKADAPLQRFLEGVLRTPEEIKSDANRSRGEKHSAAMKEAWARRRERSAGGVSK